MALILQIGKFYLKPNALPKNVLGSLGLRGWVVVTKLTKALIAFPHDRICSSEGSSMIAEGGLDHS